MELSHRRGGGLAMANDDHDDDNESFQQAYYWVVDPTAVSNNKNHSSNKNHSNSNAHSNKNTPPDPRGGGKQRSLSPHKERRPGLFRLFASSAPHTGTAHHHHHHSHRRDSDAVAGDPQLLSTSSSTTTSSAELHSHNNNNNSKNNKQQQQLGKPQKQQNQQPHQSPPLPKRKNILEPILTATIPSKNQHPPHVSQHNNNNTNHNNIMLLALPSNHTKASHNTTSISSSSSSHEKPTLMSRVVRARSPLQRRLQQQQQQPQQQPQPPPPLSATTTTNPHRMNPAAAITSSAAAVSSSSSSNNNNNSNTNMKNHHHNNNIKSGSSRTSDNKETLVHDLSQDVSDVFQGLRTTTTTPITSPGGNVVGMTQAEPRTPKNHHHHNNNTTSTTPKVVSAVPDNFQTPVRSNVTTRGSRGSIPEAHQDTTTNNDNNSKSSRHSNPAGNDNDPNLLEPNDLAGSKTTVPKKEEEIPAPTPTPTRPQDTLLGSVLTIPLLSPAAATSTATTTRTTITAKQRRSSPSKTHNKAGSNHHHNHHHNNNNKNHNNNSHNNHHHNNNIHNNNNHYNHKKMPLRTPSTRSLPPHVDPAAPDEKNPLSPHPPETVDPNKDTENPVGRESPLHCSWHPESGTAPMFQSSHHHQQQHRNTTKTATTTTKTTTTTTTTTKGLSLLFPHQDSRRVVSVAVGTTSLTSSILTGNYQFDPAPASSRRIGSAHVISIQNNHVVVEQPQPQPQNIREDERNAASRPKETTKKPPQDKAAPAPAAMKASDGDRDPNHKTGSRNGVAKETTNPTMNRWTLEIAPGIMVPLVGSEETLALLRARRCCSSSSRRAAGAGAGASTRRIRSMTQKTTTTTTRVGEEEPEAVLAVVDEDHVMIQCLNCGHAIHSIPKATHILCPLCQLILRPTNKNKKSRFWRNRTTSTNKKSHFSKDSPEDQEQQKENPILAAMGFLLHDWQKLKSDAFL